MKYYLIKRHPDFAEKGLLVRRTVNNKSYSETMIGPKNRPVASRNIAVGDKVFVAETQYGIYSEGIVRKVEEPKTFETIDSVLQFLQENRIKEDAYWMDKIKRFYRKMKDVPGTVFKYHQYYIDQKMLNRTVPFFGKLARVVKPGNAHSFIEITEEESEYIAAPSYQNEQELMAEIPARLKLDLYSMINRIHKLDYWIDIDHFVPRSAGGPGNIVQNLVPVGMSINRRKRDAIPIGLFKVAEQYDDLKRLVPSGIGKIRSDFLSKKEFAHSYDAATKITSKVRTDWAISEAKTFYLKILMEHLPKYAEHIYSEEII